MKRLVAALVVLGGLTGCQSANISASMRPIEKDFVGMETRCEYADMRDNGEMKQVSAKYDGWRAFYISEYTTGNRFGTVGVICYERPYKAKVLGEN
jgi:hypothetical protein